MTKDPIWSSFLNVIYLGQNFSLPETISAVKPKKTIRHCSLDSYVNLGKKYKLVVNLQTIELNLKNPVDCILE